MTKYCVMMNTFGADWRIYASYVQMHRVRNDAYMRHSTKYARCGLTYINAKAITFRILVCLQRTFPQMVFISRHAHPENFIKVDQKHFELWSLVANHLTEPRLQDFQEVKPRPRVGNLYYSKSHLDTFPTVKKTMGATKPFWHLKWNNRFSTTDFLHWPSWLCL